MELAYDSTGIKRNLLRPEAPWWNQSQLCRLPLFSMNRSHGRMELMTTQVLQWGLLFINMCTVLKIMNLDWACSYGCYSNSSAFPDSLNFMLSQLTMPLQRFKRNDSKYTTIWWSCPPSPLQLLTEISLAAFALYLLTDDLKSALCKYFSLKISVSENLLVCWRDDGLDSPHCRWSNALSCSLYFVRRKLLQVGIILTLAVIHLEIHTVILI